MILFEDFFQFCQDVGEVWPIVANRPHAHSLPRKCDQRLRQRWAAGARIGWRHTGGGDGSIRDPGWAKWMRKVHAVKPRWWNGFSFNGRSENRWDFHCGLTGCRPNADSPRKSGLHISVFSTAVHAFGF